MPIYGSEFQKLEDQKNWTTFLHLKNQHFSAKQMANQWLITKSKPRYAEYSWSNQSMPSILQAVTNVSKNRTFIFDALLDPLSVLHPSKMVPSYSLGTCPPKSLKTHWSLVTPSSRKKLISEDTWFCQKYLYGPGDAKTWHVSEVVTKCHRRCLKLLWVQIWQKNSNGKCPKLLKRDSHAPCY